MARIWTPKSQDFALTLPLGLLCLLLGGALLMELLFVQRAASSRAHDAEATDQQQLPGSVEPDAVFELPPLDEFSAFVDRPLFVEGRKPPPAEGEQTQAPKAEDLAPLELSLMGVMLSPHGQMAILAEASGKNRRVKLGGTIDGWRLTELKPDRITLQRGEEQRDLPLMKPRPKGPPATAAAPGQPGLLPPGARRGKMPVPAQPQPAPPQPAVEVNEPGAEEMVEPADTGEPAGFEGEE